MNLNIETLNKLTEQHYKLLLEAVFLSPKVQT